MNITTTEYLQALYGKCTHGDIVFVGHTRNYVTGHFSVTDIDAAAKHIEANPLDLFIKVNAMDHSKTLASNKNGIGGKNQVEAIVSFHLDVDASTKNGEKYTDQNALIDALGNMPLVPSNIILTDGPDGGLHAYWLLDDPHYITDEDDRTKCGAMAQRWLEELRLKVKAIDENATVDGTADLCRLLRPIGSKRKNGNRVDALKWNPERRYKLDQFALPDLPGSQPAYDWSGPAGASVRTEGENIIEQYLDTVGKNTVEAILFEQGYERWKGSDRFLIRPGSSSGVATGEIFTLKDGRRGFTVKSGAASPLSNVNSKGANGKWYSVAALWVTFKHGGDWKKAAKECYDFLRPPDIQGIDDLNEPKSSPSGDKQPEQPKADKPKPALRRATSYVTSYMDKLRNNKLPQLYPQHDALRGFEWGPGMVTLLAGKPGGGKTALATQLMLDALELDPNLRVIVANGEMDFETIVRRLLSRKNLRLDSHLLRFGRDRAGNAITEHELAKVQAAADELILQLERVTILAECNLSQLTLLKDEEPAGLIVDYLQLFANGDKDARSGVNEVVKELLALKLLGWGVLALSSIKRNQKGIYDDKDLSISSFKESGDCEFTADSGYVLGVMDEEPVVNKPWIQDVILMHVKNRHGFALSHKLRFNKARQHFDEIPKEPSEHAAQFAGDFSDNPYATTGGF